MDKFKPLQSIDGSRLDYCHLFNAVIPGFLIQGIWRIRFGGLTGMIRDG